MKSYESYYSKQGVIRKEQAVPLLQDMPGLLLSCVTLGTSPNHSGPMSTVVQHGDHVVLDKTIPTWTFNSSRTVSSLTT